MQFTWSFDYLYGGFFIGDFFGGGFFENGGVLDLGLFGDLLAEEDGLFGHQFGFDDFLLEFGDFFFGYGSLVVFD